MRETIITLSRSIVVGGVSTSQLTLREPTVGTEEDAVTMAMGLGRERNILTSEICAMSLLTGVPYDVLRQFSPLDYEKLRRAYDDFTRPTAPRSTHEVPPDGTQETSGGPSDAAS